MATTSLASTSHRYHHSLLSRSRPNRNSAVFRAPNRGRLPPLRCSPASQPATGGEEDESGRRLSKQSSWEAKDSQGDDYLYRLGKEAENMNIAVGARAGVVDDLFVGNFLGKDSDIVFDYRQKATRTFQYLQGDYYIAPIFLDKVGKNSNVMGPCKSINKTDGLHYAGIWGGKGQGKTFQTELIFRAMDVEPVIMSAGELESEWAGNTQMTVNNQIVAGTLMNLADNPTRVSIGQKWRESDITNRVPIIITGNDLSTLYAPLIRDGRMEKFYWQPDREDIINTVHGMYTKDGISLEDVSRIVDTFPNQALDFYGALRSRTYDQAILKWVDDIGGYEKLNEKLLKRKKGEKLPTFIPPKIVCCFYTDGRGVLVKLHDDIQTCAYEDVQVMWEMLQRSETDRLAREPSPKGARALVWLRRHHKMDPRRRG
ncbi:hypothetical protein PR202_gb14081 [Eleusine coracana subsp. coracana]|uniref:Ribulose bisphosphate carboxylase/oxygenase activase AAA helical domain-containing protein n=1 Tax=Eleusine coracana subsp. coracana TaxID=191504 RepID=A0AAV5EUB5_ELECO|nr:hypothetical protein PR202_gb14081 [Eleusine coracana subsp. coracana]